MTTSATTADSFTEFVKTSEPQLRRALVAALGAELGSDATAEALAYAWQNWERVAGMNNPVGYLYRVGRSRAPYERRRHQVVLPAVGGDMPWVEPGLPAALASLSESQRVCVVLAHCHGYSLSEVGELLGVAKATVQRHVDRGMRRLRNALGVRE